MTSSSTTRISNRARIRLGGFTLVELLVVVGILAILASVGLKVFRDRIQENTRQQVVADYVNDISLVARAAREYARTNAPTWAVDTRVDITLAQLSAAGLLPASFANRSTGNGTTPFGNTYAIAAQRNAQNRARAVVAETGAANAARLQALGLTDATTLASIKRDIAAKLVSSRVAGGAVIGAASTNATGGGSNPWTMNVAGFLAAAPAQPAAAALVGFPELEPEGTGSTPTGGINLGQCRVSSPTCTGTSQLCPNPSEQVAAQIPSGRTVQGRWPHCMISGGDSFFPVAQNSAVITLGRTVANSRSFSDSDCGFYANSRCGNCGDINDAVYRSAFSDCQSRTTAHTYTDVILNNGIQQQNWCRYDGHFFQGTGTQMRIFPTSTSWPQNAPTSDEIFVCG